jgi:Killing trait
MGMTYLAMADSIGLVMQNAAANQQRGQVVATAAVTQSLVLIIKLGGQSK